MYCYKSNLYGQICKIILKANQQEREREREYNYELKHSKSGVTESKIVLFQYPIHFCILFW